MTTEDDFQKLLDAKPDDHHTRLVFADWLQERNDPRAEGYRALGARGHAPLYPRSEAVPSPWYCCADTDSARWLLDDDGSAAKHFYPDQCRRAAILPPDWFNAIELEGKNQSCAPYFTNRDDCPRSELDDAVALAFAKLSAERRAELLAGKVPARKPKGKRQKPKKRPSTPKTARKPGAKKPKGKRKK